MNENRQNLETESGVPSDNKEAGLSDEILPGSCMGTNAEVEDAVTGVSSFIAGFLFKYFAEKKLKIPNFNQAMQFAHTEIAEVYELTLARDGGWKRNHPMSSPVFNKEGLAEELGDAIMMLIMAGLVEEVNPIEALLKKITRD